MSNRKALDAVASELVKAFDVKIPPVPVESMLQRPPDGMWKELDVRKLSGTFLNIRDIYSPRMSLCRLLVRHIINSEWGKERQLHELIKAEDHVHRFARMILMPQEMINALSPGARNPIAVSMQFEVPEDEARLRLQEIDTLF